MSETAVGLFTRSQASAVIDGLTSIGFPAGGIRVIGAADSDASEGRMGGGSGSFSRDFREMGATEAEVEGYAAGVDQGHILIYATGTKPQADAAARMMNEYAAIEVEEFATASAGASKAPGSSRPISGNGELGTIHPEPRLPESTVTIGAHEKSYTSHASRSKTEGVRVFSW